jgi:hypothetical protein
VRGDFAYVTGVFAKSDEIVGVHARCVNAPWKVGVCAYQGRRSERPGATAPWMCALPECPQTQCRSTRGSSS